MASSGTARFVFRFSTQLPLLVQVGVPTEALRRPGALGSVGGPAWTRTTDLYIISVAL